MMELDDAGVDYEKKIETLEQELKRKDEMIQELKEKNRVLFKTAVKNADREVETALRADENI